jgi:hypothetical protein
MKLSIFKLVAVISLITLIAGNVGGRANAERVAAPEQNPVAAPAAVTTTYTADNSVFSNPERGFHNRYDIITDRDFSRSTNTNNTLVHSYVRLDNFRSSNISQSFLDQLSAGLAAARNQGMKVILRVSYNFGPYPNSEPDATEFWINQHLNQLAPVLSSNQDVIAFIEAGFIGAWGEWHTSTNGLDTDMAAKIRIANSILAAVPASRQVALRYPSDVRAVINGGVSSARLGNHQDCFLASDPDDWGTWARDPNYSVQQDKDYIATVGLNHPVGGETCNVSSPRATCTTARTEMQWMRFSELNEDYEPGVINVFKSQGCFDEFKRNLGYRFRLIDATYPASASSGSSFNLQVNLTNDGYASPYNQRPVFAVLDGAGGTFTFPLSYDPRNWESGQSVAINQSFTLPSMPAGTYRLSLWLPDDATGLRANPKYSIRVANQNVWDATKGYNVLANSITIGSGGNPTNTPTRTNTPVGPTNTPTRTPTPGGSTTSYEAESASNTLAGGAAVAACGTCSGGNKVGYVGNNSGTLQFNGIAAASAGNYTLTIYYLSAEARSVQISVNGGAVTSVSLPSTGSWTTVGSAQATVSLNAGNNTIRFSNSSGWAPDFDRITLNTSGGAPTNTPTRTNTPVGPTNTPTRTPTRTNTPVGPTNTPTRTPTPSGSILLLDNFDGSPAWPGTNDLGKWAGANSFVNGSGALSGGALVLQYNNSGWFGSDVLQDVSSKTYLVFVIKGAAGGEQNGFRVSLGGVEKTFAAFSGDTITTAYKTIRINMVTNGVNRSSPGQLNMTFWWGSSGTITIDEIRFE